MAKTQTEATTIQSAFTGSPRDKASTAMEIMTANPASNQPALEIQDNGSRFCVFCMRDQESNG